MNTDPTVRKELEALYEKLWRLWSDNEGKIERLDDAYISSALALLAKVVYENKERGQV